MAKRHSLLGEILINAGIITAEYLEKAQDEQLKTSEYLGTVLTRLGYAREGEIYTALSKHLGIEYVRVKDMYIDPEVIKKVPAKVVCHYKIMPLKLENNTLTVAMPDPLDVRILDELGMLLGYEVKGVFCGEKEILEALRNSYGVAAETIEKMLEEEGYKERPKVEAVATEDLETLAADASVIKLVNQILLHAYQDRATDIHIEPYEDELKVRYRIDGILYDTTIPPIVKHFQQAIVSRIKIMANLNIAEKRLPQDGRMKVKVGGSDMDLRVSVLPTQFGESVQVRLLTSNILLGIETLGLLENELKIMESLVKNPHGIIFLTGPTGSGKTTMQYACLSRLNESDKKIITIEDPVEYQLRGVTQVQVNPKIGLTFAAGLRAMLRHDPDIMMVGEVRDLETAEITIRVALTGHLVFSTLHTNDAAGGVTRLVDMGIEPFLVSSSVLAFIAQRLVRLICPKCKAEVPLKKALLEDISAGEDLSKVKIYEGKGCEACKFTGYLGRTGIFEILLITDKIRDSILKRTSANEIKKLALSQGMKTLRMDGWEKIKRGQTTVDEVVRVTQLEG